MFDYKQGQCLSSSQYPDDLRNVPSPIATGDSECTRLYSDSTCTTPGTELRKTYFTVPTNAPSS
jgi:hypothetical protein